MCEGLQKYSNDRRLHMYVCIHNGSDYRLPVNICIHNKIYTHMILYVCNYLCMYMCVYRKYGTLSLDLTRPPGCALFRSVSGAGNSFPDRVARPEHSWRPRIHQSRLEGKKSSPSSELWPCPLVYV